MKAWIKNVGCDAGEGVHVTKDVGISVHPEWRQMNQRLEELVALMNSLEETQKIPGATECYGILGRIPITKERTLEVLRVDSRPKIFEKNMEV